THREDAAGHRAEREALGEPRDGPGRIPQRPRVPLHGPSVPAQHEDLARRARGAHAEVLDERGLPRPRQGVRVAPAVAGALDAIRVLDLGTRIGAPFAATLLGELGADVVKVERPGTGDFMRTIPPFEGDVSLWWAVEGRGK